MLALVASGCSTARLAYNNAPELGYWWIDGYLDLGETQSVKLRADLATLQAWHRQNELPLYVATLEKLRGLASGNFTPNEVCEWTTITKTRFQSLVTQSEPALLALAASVKPDQITHLTQQFEKHNKKWRAEWVDVSPSERSARWIKQMTDRGEMAYGRLDEPQQAILRAQAASTAFDANLRYREILRRQQDTLSTLRQLSTGQWSDQRIKAEVRALITRSLESPEAGYRRYAEKMTLESCQSMAALHNSTNPAQRRKLVDNLLGYEGDVRALMSAGR